MQKNVPKKNQINTLKEAAELYNHQSHNVCSQANIQMNSQNKKQVVGIQSLLNEQSELEGVIAHLQTQIDQRETLYLERTWYEGNIYIGWNKNIPTTVGPPQTRVTVDPKEKLFSLSSITSPAFAQLGSNVDRQLLPYGQHRFQSKKHKNNKSKNSHSRRVARPIGKKTRN